MTMHKLSAGALARELAFPIRAKTLPRSARQLLRLLDAVRGSRVEVMLPDGERVALGDGDQRVDLRLRDWGVLDLVFARGDIGFAEGYVAGGWESSDLASLLTVLATNRERLERAIHGRWLSLLADKLLHGLRANTRVGSRRNIAAHYDLGNDFYRAWLDGTMSYSSALFEGDESRTLEQAQLAKYRRILDRLDLRVGDSVLEIGCGWGGFAEEAVRAGARVLGITLSRQQLAYADARAARWGDQPGSARFELRDYRDVAGEFDHIVSIEMLEAVGERYWPLYFRRLRELLKPGGSAAIQVITIDDALFGRYRRQTDFIQRYIFPGGMLPSRLAFAANARAAGLEPAGEFAFGADYARTLAHWRSRFERRSAALAAAGYGHEFQRLWRFYLAYCEAGFRARSIDVHQFVLRRPVR
jgi:cyclopropane-fatty-acyl-phospholipid synthase